MLIAGNRNKFITGYVKDAGMRQADPLQGRRMMNPVITFIGTIEAVFGLLIYAVSTGLIYGQSCIR